MKQTNNYSAKWAILIGIILLLASGVGLAEGQQTSALPGKIIKLKFSQHYPVNHVVTIEGIQPFMRRVEELTKGQVKFDFYPGEQLAKARDQFELVSSGGVDIAGVVPSYARGQMPLSGVMELPSIYDSPIAGTKVYWQLCQGILLQTDFLKNGVRPIFTITYEPYEIFTTSRPVRLPEDLKGLKIRSAGGDVQTEVLKSLGATPVFIASTELYEGMQRKVIDGAVLPFGAAKSYRIQEVSKFATVGSSVSGLPITWVINENIWKSLPGEVKEAILKAGEEMSNRLAQALDRESNQVLKVFESAGVKIAYITPKENEKWVETLSPIQDGWAKNMEAKGFPGEKVLQETERLNKIVGRIKK